MFSSIRMDDNSIAYITDNFINKLNNNSYSNNSGNLKNVMNELYESLGSDIKLDDNSIRSLLKENNFGYNLGNSEFKNTVKKNLGKNKAGEISYNLLTHPSEIIANNYMEDVLHVINKDYKNKNRVDKTNKYHGSEVYTDILNKFIPNLNNFRDYSHDLAGRFGLAYSSNRNN